MNKGYGKNDLIPIDIEDISIGENRRPVNQETVELLAKSIKEIGLQTPISVWMTEDKQYVHLVAGRHRLEAAKLLGWTKMNCILVNLDETQRRMWEISENLHRADLSSMERHDLTGEWIKLASSRKGVPVDHLSEGGKFVGGRGNEGGLSATARELGMDRATAHRSVKVHAMSPEAKGEARALGLDSNRDAYLRAASQPTAEDQIRSLREDDARKRAQRNREITASDRRVDAAIKAVEKLSPEERRVFEHNFKPVRPAPPPPGNPVTTLPEAIASLIDYGDQPDEYGRTADDAVNDTMTDFLEKLIIEWGLDCLRDDPVDPAIAAAVAVLGGAEYVTARLRPFHERREKDRQKMEKERQREEKRAAKLIAKT